MKTIVVLPDGSEIQSGVIGETAVQSLQLTRCVNADHALSPGAVCAAMAELRLWTYGELFLEAGQELTLFREENGQRQQLGIFLLEKPTCVTANTLSLTAYDRIVKLDRDLTAWLASRKQWPCPVVDLARAVCEECGLELAQGELPNNEYQVGKFNAEGITGRQLMQWIAQLAGRFVRATPDGKVEFAWYVPATVAIAPDSRESQFVSASNGAVTLVLPDGAAHSDGRGGVIVDCSVFTAQLQQENLTVTARDDKRTVFYYQDGLSRESFETLPISRVVLRQSDQDIGVGYPEDSGEENPYVITANPMLTGGKSALQKVAQVLYEQLRHISYTPCRITLESNDQLEAGHTVQVQDKNGRFFTAYIMTKRVGGGRQTLECTGSYRRGTATELHSQSYQSLQGRVLNLRKDMDGLLVSAQDAQENLAQVQLSLSGLQATVQKQSEDGRLLSALEQTADSLQLRIQKLESGSTQVKTHTGYTFDENGLHIQKSGQEMENSLDHTGMYVRRGNTALLQANHRGVEAADVTVRNYLVVGDHARFEPFSGGTGCFWI